MIDVGMNANDNDNHDGDDNGTLPPLIRLLVVNLETPSSNPADVTAIGLVEMEIYSGQAVINAIEAAAFGVDRPCTRDHLDQVLSCPEAIDALVNYDLSRTKEVVQASLPEVMPWVGIGRLLVQLGRDLGDRSAEAIALEVGLGKDLAQARSARDATSRDAAATTLLTTLLHEQLGLDRMISLSRNKVRPLRSRPSLDDVMGWAAMPHADVEWAASNQAAPSPNGFNPDLSFDDAVTGRAVRELHLRRHLARQS